MSGSPFSTDPYVLVSTPHFYTLKVKDMATNCSSTAGINATDSAIAISTVVDSDVCSNSNNGAAHVTVSGGGGGFHFSWLNFTGNEVSNTDSASTLVAGNYTIIVYDDYGCSNSTTVTIATMRM